MLKRKTFCPSARLLLSVGVPLLLLAAGLYIVLLAMSPTLSSLPIVREAAKKQIAESLSEPPAKDNRLYIPKLGINIAVVAGSDESALLRGAWHRKPENGSPKDGGNFVLSAHRFSMGLTPQGTVAQSPFYHIEELEVGDAISVDYEKKRYEYKITRTYRVNPTQVSIEKRTEEPKLTLYSCTLRGSADGRDVIEARLKSD